MHLGEVPPAWAKRRRKMLPISAAVLNLVQTKAWPHTRGSSAVAFFPQTGNEAQDNFSKQVL